MKTVVHFNLTNVNGFSTNNAATFTTKRDEKHVYLAATVYLPKKPVGDYGVVDLAISKKDFLQLASILNAEKRAK